MVYRHLNDRGFSLTFRVLQPIRRKYKKRDALLVHEGRDLTVCQLSAFEQFVSCEAKEDLGVDRVRAHERPVIGQGLGRLVDLTLAEDRVRARSARGARQAQEVRRRRTQPEEEGHRAEYAARGEWRRLRTGAAGSGSGRVRW